ncbi:MAG: carA 1 [Holophagaceae bacterium]|nr:carA 1 [Holophagaceae bacterium]
MKKVITADQAARLIPDGAVVGASVMGLSGWAEEVVQAVDRRFVEESHPRQITLIHGSAVADMAFKGGQERGTTRLGKEGLVKRWVSGILGTSAGLSKLLMENKLEGYCLPQGVITQLWREIAAKRPGLITKVGLGTFVDPRVEGGKMNAAATEDLVKVVQFEGEEFLFYKSFPVDVAIIRGTCADENGNITMDKEGMLLEALPLAQAAKNSGGIVIAQVEHLVKNGTLNPKDVRVPGILVDHVVVATSTDYSWQTSGVYYNPAFAGEIKVPLGSLPELPMDERKIIARRAAMELSEGDIVNLGVGMPTDVAAVAAEEGVSEMMTLTTESGAIGGVPASQPNFGHAYNAEAIVDHHAQFDFYDGGGLDVAFLGFAQVDRVGNVNVSKFKGRPNGCGGFINITQTSKKIVYCGSFTAGGLAVEARNGKLVILHEGKNTKFFQDVEQITFSGKYASQIKQPVLYVTERAVFRLEKGELTLIEIAPGVDMEKDILRLMAFKPRISPDLKLMPSEIFQPNWGELKRLLTNGVEMIA